MMTKVRRHQAESWALSAGVAGISIALLWIVAPFFGAIVGAIVAAILFAPFNRRLIRAMPMRRNVSASITIVAMIIVIVIPALMLGFAIFRELSGLFVRFQSGNVDIAKIFAHFEASLPDWARQQLAGSGLGNFESVQARLRASFADAPSLLARPMLLIGQGAANALIGLGVMLYVTFFLIRDGAVIAARIEQALPLPEARRRLLFDKFVTVVRATIKGSAIVGLIQGAAGGLVFWVIGLQGALLWGAAMAVLSLLPMIGAGFVWVPVALFLLVTGSVWQGVALALSGALIISTIDNIVRPILVGRDTRLPDYVVLVSTLGGLEVMGISGLVVGPVVAAMFIAVWQMVIETRDTPAASG